MDLFAPSLGYRYSIHAKGKDKDTWIWRFLLYASNSPFAAKCDLSMKSILLTFILLFASTSASAGFIVDAEVFDDEKLIGKPRLIVEANEKARVFLDGVYDLTLTVNPKQEEALEFVTRILVDGQRLTPTLDAKLGKQFALEQGKHKFVFVVNRTRE